MNFDEFVSQAWRDHATQTSAVADRMDQGIALIEGSEQIAPMAQLVTHVFGEHLAQWSRGLEILMKIKKSVCFSPDDESQGALARSMASLEFASGERESLEELPLSDQVRVLSFAASALNEQKNTEKAQTYLMRALDRAEQGLAPGDPAHRALAITGNNLAVSLEEKPTRSAQETELMLLAAQTARKFWEQAGTWLQVERAEYRLSMTYLQAGDPGKAWQHAENCVNIARENGAPPLELFFGFEAMTLIARARSQPIIALEALAQAKTYFEQLPQEDKAWCEGTLLKIS